MARAQFNPRLRRENCAELAARVAKYRRAHALAERARHEDAFLSLDAVCGWDVAQRDYKAHVRQWTRDVFLADLHDAAAGDRQAQAGVEREIRNESARPEWMLPVVAETAQALELDRPSVFPARKGQPPKRALHDEVCADVQLSLYLAKVRGQAPRIEAILRACAAYRHMPYLTVRTIWVRRLNFR